MLVNFTNVNIFLRKIGLVKQLILRKNAGRVKLLMLQTWGSMSPVKVLLPLKALSKQTQVHRSALVG